MSVNFKNLLPKLMRPTRWGELMQAIQSIDTDFRTQKVNPIFEKYTRQATNAELLALADLLGFKVVSIFGYTATNMYLQKQVETIADRIKHRAADLSYMNTGYIYNLWAENYPMYVSATSPYSYQLCSATLFAQPPQTLTVTSLDPEGDNLLYYIGNTPIYGTPQHTGLPATSLDTPEFASLDPVVLSNGNQITSISRNITFSYFHKTMESVGEFMNIYTLQALKNDTDQICKATEHVYHEPWLKFNTNGNKTLTIENINDYNGQFCDTTNSLLIGNNLLDAAYAQFGTGDYLPSGVIPSGTIPGVKTFSYVIPSGIPSGIASGVLIASGVPSGVCGWNFYSSPSASGIHFDVMIGERNKFTSFSELSILNSSKQCVYYASFPQVKWDPTMYNNVRIQIKLV
jgi:hypothetical protein